MQCDFRRKRVLIVEDNGLAAAEIAFALEAANAIVVGPCSDLDDAGMQARHSDLAVLDIDIQGRTSFALADRLQQLDVPYVFFTGYDRKLLPARFAKIDYICKPLSPGIALQHLETLSRELASLSIVELVPMLRQQARMHFSDPLAADRLVERALQLAIDDSGRLPHGRDLGRWLLDLMDHAMRSGRSQFLN